MIRYLNHQVGSEGAMRLNIHPQYTETTVRCTCGNEFTSRSTAARLNVEICSSCHPFYTGQQKLSDTAGRVDRFNRRRAHASARQTSARAIA
jgi:large subunit ribosomal protein L31